MKYGFPTLFRQPIWVTLLSDKDVKFLLQPLSYKDIFGSTEAFYAATQDSSFSTSSIFTFLTNSVLDFKGITGASSVEQALSALSINDKQYLEQKLSELSIVTPEQLNNIKTIIHLLTNPTLKDGSYTCEKCKAVPGLPESRNCPLLNKPPTAKFKLRINDVTYARCPVPDIDIYISNQIITASNFINSHTLPLEGGMGNQSMWFVEASQQYQLAIQSTE